MESFLKKAENSENRPKHQHATYFSVVTPDVQSPGGKVVFLNKFNSGHKPSNSDVVRTVLQRETRQRNVNELYQCTPEFQAFIER